VIVRFEELKHHRRTVAMVDGGFDPLHQGHVEYFRVAAALLRTPVLCNVASDTYVAKKHPPLLPEAQRAAVIDALRYVDLTHVSHTSTAEGLRELQPLYYVKGIDWRDRLPPEELDICRTLGIEVVYVDTPIDSSSEILERFLRQAHGRVR
jgi:cytidyltransferase-like protein